MTKLVEWITVVTGISILWAIFAFDLIGNVPKYIQNAVLPLPIFLILGFGIISLGIIIYRVLTFNDCPEAAKELKAQIVEARKDLESKGFKFESKKES